MRPTKRTVKKVTEKKAVRVPVKKVSEIKEMTAIAILCHFRTGSTLLRKVFVACGMVDCYREMGYGVGDINGIGNAIFHKHIQTPGEAVNEVLTLFREAAISKEWKHYGIKVDHVLQSVCWEGVGKPFLEHWPDAKYVVSIRHPAGILKSFEKIRENTPAQDPGFTDQQIIDSWLSTYSATQYLLDKKDATLVVYPHFYKSGDIKDVVEKLGLEWTKEADELLDAKVLEVSGVSITEIREFEKKYPAATEMFEELVEHLWPKEGEKALKKIGN